MSAKQISCIREYGPKLIENGYLICDIAPGKKACLRKGWVDNPLSVQACKQHPAAEGVGILCGQGDHPVCGIDADFDGTEAEGEELLQKLREACPKLEEAVCRVGRPGRFLLIARSDGRWAKSTTSFYRQGERTARLEVLGYGQQFVAYHTHPETGKPYYYPEPWVGEPLTTPVTYLPLLTMADVDVIKDAFVDFLEAKGFERKDESATALISLDDWLAEELTPRCPVGLKLSEIKEIFERCDWDWTSYDSWREGGMRIHHETGGSAEGLALWDELSARSSSYGGFEVCERKWESFHRSGGGRAVTMWPLAKKVGFGSALATELNESGLMYRVIRDHGNHIRYIPSSQTWLYFNPATRLWEDGFSEAYVCEAIIEKVVIHALSKEAAEETNPDRAQAILEFQEKCKKTLATVMLRVKSLLKGAPEICSEVDEFDMDTTCVAVTNGLVDLATHTLMENTPERRMRRHCNVVYDPAADCPLWRSCVAEWFESAEVAEYVQKVLGKMLMGKPEDDAFYILVGEGANGKSVFTGLLNKLMGSYSKTLEEGTILGTYSTAGGSARSDLADLPGKRFAYCSEIGENAVLRASDVKRFTGRDTITMRAPYGRRDQAFVPQFTMFVATNYEPKIRGVDNAIRRRVKIIRFPRDYENDPAMRAKRIWDLTDRLEAEIPGIFNWLLEGYDKAKRDGMAVPREVRLASDEYVDTQDLVTQWMKERLVADESARLPVKDAFTNFISMLEEQNENWRGYSQVSFTSRLRRALDRRGHKDAIVKSNGMRSVRGFKLREPESPDDFEVL